MEVLHEWWKKMDPENRRIIQLNDFKELIREKRIITRDSEILRLLKSTIPDNLK